jgi:hypothetical protein
MGGVIAGRAAAPPAHLSAVQPFDLAGAWFPVRVFRAAPDPSVV